MAFRKFGAVLIAGALFASLAACGDDDDTEGTAETTEPAAGDGGGDAEGGIKWSSQHLESEVVHGAAKRLGSCGDGKAGDAVAGSAAWLAA